MVFGDDDDVSFAPGLVVEGRKCRCAVHAAYIRDVTVGRSLVLIYNHPQFTLHCGVTVWQCAAPCFAHCLMLLFVLIFYLGYFYNELVVHCNILLLITPPIFHILKSFGRYRADQLTSLLF
jgi:hypothetical protein